MNLIIKLLTPDLSSEYFDFFENRAFTDDSPFRCYCQVYQMSKEEYEEAYKHIDLENVGLSSRKVAEQQIRTGLLRGYLAFVDDVSIGWCNANDKANFPQNPYTEACFYAPDEAKEKAVVCFEIAPGFRGQGVATALLQRVIEDAKSEGYTAVEGFPVYRENRFEWDNVGPIRLYEKLGFIKTEEKDGRFVMRKEL